MTRREEARMLEELLLNASDKAKRTGNHTELRTLKRVCSCLGFKVEAHGHGEGDLYYIYGWEVTEAKR